MTTVTKTSRHINRNVPVTGVSSVIATTTISTPTEHNTLTSIQGGAAGEYYHLTSAEYTGTGTGNFVRLDSPTFTTKITTPALKVTTGAGAGHILVSDANGDLTYLGDGATTTILVGGGAANPVWTTATGTGAPVRAGSPTMTTMAEVLTTSDGAVIRARSSQDDNSHATNVPFGSFEVYSNDSGGGGAGIKGALKVYPTAAAGAASRMALTTSSSTVNDIERMSINNDGSITMYQLTSSTPLTLQNSAALSTISGGTLLLTPYQTPTANTDRLGAIMFSGITTGTTQAYTARIHAHATQAWDVDSAGTEMRFYTTPNDSVTALERVTITHNGNVEEPNFTTGWQGSNWQITNAGAAEFESMLIRGSLSVYEFVINQLRYQDGGIILGAGGGKIASVVDDSPGSEILTFEDPEGNGIIPFSVGAIVMLQEVDIDKTTIVKQIVREVTDADASDYTIEFAETAGWTIAEDTGVFEVGDVVVAIGHKSDTNLQNIIYMSATDSNSPFIRMHSGIDSYADFGTYDNATLKLVIGNLEGIAEYDIVPASPGYGLYCDNVFLTGKIVATSGEIGGWVISANSIEDAEGTCGLTVEDESDNAIRIWAGGSDPNSAPFQVTRDGDLTATGCLELGTLAESYSGNWINVAIKGGHIYEASYDGDVGALFINWEGYQGGFTKYRYLVIGDGKGNELAEFGPTEAIIQNDQASAFPFRVFNDGNNLNRYGMEIWCGVDTPSSSYNRPIGFFSGDGTEMGWIICNNVGPEFSGPSDISLKENIQSYTFDGLSIINSLNYKTFNWKSDENKETVEGWVADDVEQVFPKMVTTSPLTGNKMLTPTKLIPVLVQSIQQLTKRIEELEKT